ncbi:toxin glutamine deamidase domain-containing protein [Micromonospora sp. DT4]|uniref:toxin glutamine deamidase domain-containing protein n=1 Tax=Micromonospora sp. DT4 TaxID=3393438 RepID=UPI003CF29A6B
MIDTAVTGCAEQATTWVKSGWWITVAGVPVPDAVLDAPSIPGSHLVYIDPAAIGSSLVADLLRSQPPSVIAAMVYVPLGLEPDLAAMAERADQLRLPVLVTPPESLDLDASRVRPFEAYGETEAVLVWPTTHLVDTLFPRHVPAEASSVAGPDRRITQFPRSEANSSAVIPSRFDNDEEARRAYSWLAHVNPDHSSTNCVLTAIVSDMNAGNSDIDWAAGAADVEYEAHLVNYQRQQLGLPDDAIPPVYRTDVQAARAAMQAAPLGSRAILLVRDPALESLGATSHAFNVLHDEHGVVFLDGQQGGLARIPAHPGEQFLLPLTAHIPAPAEAEWVAPGVLDGVAAGLGIEAEREAIVVPASPTDGNKLVATWRARADGRILMFTKLDKRSYFESIDGYLHTKRDIPQDAKRHRFWIIEDVTIPTVVYPDGDVGRPDWNPISQELKAVAERLGRVSLWRRGSIEESTAIEKIYPPEAGWEIGEDFQRARVLIARPNTGDYIQWTVDVPLGDGVDLAQWLLKEGRTYLPSAHRILREGIAFGRLIAAHYLDVKPADVERYRHEPGVAELWDFMTHVYTHASAVSFHVNRRFPDVQGLAKNRLAIALRNPLTAVRAALPAPVRGYLEYAATTIKEQWAKHRGFNLREKYPPDSWTPELRSGSLLDCQLETDTIVSIGDYLDNALLARPAKPIDQCAALGINSGGSNESFKELYNNDGRLKDTAVYEIRNLLDSALSHEQMNALRLELINQLRDTRKAREEYERGEGLPHGTGPAERAPWINLANDLAHLVEALNQPVWRDNLEPVGQELLRAISRRLGALTLGFEHQGWRKSLAVIDGRLGRLRELLGRTHAGNNRLSEMFERIDRIALQSASIATLSSRQRILAGYLLPAAAQPNGSGESLLHLLAEHPADTNRKLADSRPHERMVTSAILSELTSPVWGRTFVILPTTTAQRLVDGERFLLCGQHEDFNEIPAGHSVVVVDSFSRVIASSQPESRFILPSDGSIALKQYWPNVAHFRYEHPTQMATLERLLPDGMLEDALLPPRSRRSDRVYWVGHAPPGGTEANIREASQEFAGPVIFVGAYRRGAEAAARHVRDVRHLAQLFALKQQQPVVVTDAKISPALQAVSAAYGFSILHLAVSPAKTSDGLASLNLDPFWRLTGGDGTNTDLATTFAAWFLTSAAKSVKPAEKTPSWAVGGLLLASNKAAKLEALAEFGKQLTSESAVNELAEITKQVDNDLWFRKFTPLLGELGKQGKAEFVLDFQELDDADATRRTRLLIGEQGRMIDADLREGLIKDSFGDDEATGAATALRAVDLMFTDGLSAAVHYVRNHSGRLHNADKQHWVDAIRDLSKDHKDRSSAFLELAQEILNCQPPGQPRTARS